MRLPVFWTSYDPGVDYDRSIVDPLGFQSFAETLANSVFPSLTSRTDRIRYYSLICWGLKVIADNRSELLVGAVNPQQGIEDRLMAMEKLFVLAAVIYYNGKLPQESERRLLGSSKALNYLNDIRLRKGTVFKLNDQDYRFLVNQRSQGSFGAYKTSLIGFKLLDIQDYNLLGDENFRGIALASSLMSSGKARQLSRIVVRALLKGMITEYSLSRIGASFCLDPRRASEPEVDKIDQILRSSNPILRASMKAVSLDLHEELVEMEVVSRILARGLAKQDLLESLLLIRDYEYFCTGIAAILDHWVVCLRKGVSLPLGEVATKLDPLEIYKSIISSDEANNSELGMQLLEIIRPSLTGLSNRMVTIFENSVGTLDTSSYVDQLCLFINEISAIIEGNSPINSRLKDVREALLRRHNSLKGPYSWIVDEKGNRIPNRPDGDRAVNRFYRIITARSLLRDLDAAYKRSNK